MANAKNGWSYAEKVVNGEIPAAAPLRAACERALNDLKVEDSPYYYCEKSADRVIQFFKFLKHIKGPLAGESFVLADWQCFIVGQLYGWKRKKDDLRRFRTAYVEVPRKSGKSTLCSGLSLYHLLADGEQGAEVYAAATTKDQAKIVFGDAQQIVRKNAELSKHLKVHRTALLHDDSGSKMEPLSSDAGSLEGRSPSFSVVDELHVHKTSEVYDVLNVASGARAQPILFAITTAGTNTEGICYDVRNYSLSVVNNNVDDDTFFAAIWTIDETDDWRDPTTWIKANPGYGISVQEDDLERMAKQAQESPVAETNFKTKRLNVWCNASQAWISSYDWDKCTEDKPDIKTFLGKPCYIGLDLASVDDFASMCILFAKDGKVYPYFKHYLPEDTVYNKTGVIGHKYRDWTKKGLITITEGNVTDLSYIQQDIENLCQDYKVAEIAYDPFGAQQISANLIDKMLPMVKMSQSIMSMSDPSKELEKLIKSGQLVHGGDPILNWMISNCIIYIDPNDNIKVKKEAHANKIDGVIALIMALGRMKVNGGIQASIFETRGIRSF